MTERHDGRASNETRAIEVSFDGLTRVDGSARFGFGTKTACLVSISGPIEARLASENPSKATFEVHLFPLSGISATDSRALAASIRAALTPSLILTHNPRTLIQFVGQSLTPSLLLASHTSAGQTNWDDALAAALINAGTLALLNAGSIPMRGTIWAVSVGLTTSGNIIIDPDENELHDLVASGCYAFMFADRVSGNDKVVPDIQCVWTNWRNIPSSIPNIRRMKEEDVRQARELASAAAKEIGNVMKTQIVKMGKKQQPRIPPPPSTTLNLDVQAHANELHDTNMEVDDDKMEI
ncbi:hypothetical protein AMATHDRAFT_138653 [Amanita thiersii Skay4041]|uniref:Exoribonuclease phosphorolytic domain-containing protein n=1 Tax=Amanita thiersii Skay4041 TaxID=703135 RepID=A0A2A9NYL2_9AGAR|nr:hypothetical protein AMATHDRAFT_138653 [Amanita thiersii Skay4041]